MRRWPAIVCPSAKRTATAGKKHPPEVRLVNRKRMNWVGEMPPEEPCGAVLSGDLLSFREP